LTHTEGFTRILTATVHTIAGQHGNIDFRGRIALACRLLLTGFGINVGDRLNRLSMDDDYLDESSRSR